MTYKGYTITGEGRCYEKWDIDDDGDFKTYIETSDLEDITYNIGHPDGFYEMVYSFEEVKQLVDDRIAEMSRVVA